MRQSRIPRINECWLFLFLLCLLVGPRQSLQAQIPSGLLFNSDSGVLAHYDPPITMDQINRILNQMKGTQVSVFLPCVNFGDDTFVYETKAAEQYDGCYVKTFEDTKWGKFCKKWAENIQALRNAGHDPLRIWEKRCHELGLQFWPTLRMNEIHEDSDACAPLRSQWKIANPQLLLGNEAGSLYYSDRDTFTWAMDYAQPQVRARRLTVIEEICTNYDVDGLELDFLRHPLYFKKGQEQEGIKHMNDFIRQVREKIVAIGKQKGKTILLHVKVPERLSICECIGLDVGTWIQKGWVDCITPMAAGYLDTTANIQEFVDAAKGTSCRIFGGLERSISYYEKRATVEMLRAAAMGYYYQGASNIYLFNYDCHSEKGGFPFTEYALSILKELGDPVIIARKNKHYFITRDMQSHTPAEGGQYPLPVEFNDKNPQQEFELIVGDDLVSAKKDGALKSIIFIVTLKNFNPEIHTAEICCNNQILTDLYYVKNQFVFSFPPIIQGKNRFAVRLLPLDEKKVKPFRVEGIELLIQYKP